MSEHLSDSDTSVVQHYRVGGILDSICKGLVASGKALDTLHPADLAPVDEFHIRGREATLELVQRAALTADMKVLDVSCGLGGSARYLAGEVGCAVTGIDLTDEYVHVAGELAKLVGLETRVEFRQGSGLALPFDDCSFDAVWTEHAQMNIEDKDRFYGEIFRVLKSGGRFAFHDIFLGEGGAPHYPAPWAQTASISYLWPVVRLQQSLAGSGFRIRDWADKTQHSRDWFVATVEKLKLAGPQPLGLHLLMGETAKQKFQNQIRNLREGRIAVVQGVAERN